MCGKIEAIRKLLRIDRASEERALDARQRGGPEGAGNQSGRAGIACHLRTLP